MNTIDDIKIDFFKVIRGKTGKTVVLPRFCKIERGGCSGGAPTCYGGLT